MKQNFGRDRSGCPDIRHPDIPIRHHPTSSDIGRFPDARLTVIVLTNRAGWDAGKAALAVADLFLDEGGAVSQ